MGQPAAAVQPHALRRSTRLRWEVQITLVSLDPKVSFRETGKTLVVNLHGCGIQLGRPLPPGTRVRVEVGEDRMTGRIVESGKIDDKSFLLGIALDKPTNMWGVKDPPGDWNVSQSSSSAAPAEPAAGPTPSAALPQPAVSAAPPPAAPSDAGRDPDYHEITAQLQRLEKSQAEFQAALTAERASTQATRESAETALAEQTERVRQARAFVESLACSLPAAIKAQAQEHSKALVQQLHENALEDVSRRVRAAMGEVEARLRDTVAQMSGDLRRELLEELTRRNGAESTSTALPSEVPGLQAPGLQASLPQSAQQVSAELQRQSDRAAAQLRDAAARLIADQQQKLEQRDEAAKTALQNLGGKLLASMRQEIQAELKRQLQAISAPGSVPQKTSLPANVELQNHANDSAGRDPGEIRADQVQQMRAELERAMAGTLQRAEEARAELRQVLDSLQAQVQAQEAAVAALGRQTEHAQTWITDEMEKFKRAVHDMFIDTSGQIRGRIQQAVEMAGEPLEVRSRELQQQLAEVGRQCADQLHRSVEQVQKQMESGRQRLETSCDTAQSVAEAAVQARIESTIEAYKKQLEELTCDSVERWQAAIAESVSAIKQILPDQLAGGAKPRK